MNGVRSTNQPPALTTGGPMNGVRSTSQAALALHDYAVQSAAWALRGAPVTTRRADPAALHDHPYGLAHMRTRTAGVPG